jgi:hypothetical protein
VPDLAAIESWEVTECLKKNREAFLFRTLQCSNENSAKLLKAQPESLAFCIHPTVTAFFLDCQRGQIGDNQQGNRRQPADDDHCKGVLHNLTERRKAWGGPSCRRIAAVSETSRSMPEWARHRRFKHQHRAVMRWFLRLVCDIAAVLCCSTLALGR